MSIVDAIPPKLRQIIRQNTQNVPPYMGDTIYLILDNSEVTLSKVSPKLQYYIRRLRVENKFLQRLRKSLRRNFHIFV